MKRWGTEILLFFVVVIWGMNYTFGKFGVQEITSIEFTAIRFLIAAPILLMITFLIERSLKIYKEDFIQLLFVSLVGITIYQTLFMETIKYISATNASLLISLSPIFTTIFSLLMKQENFSFQKLLGTVVAFTGTVLVLFVQDPTSPQKDVLFGSIIGLIASISWGLYPILAAPLIQKYSPLRVTAWSATIGAAPLLFLSGSNVFVLSLTVNLTTWLSLFYSIFFVTIFGLVAWYIGVAKIGSTNTMVYMFLIPFVAVIFAGLWAKEQIHLQQIIGGLVIFIGLWIVKRQQAVSFKKRSGKKLFNQ